jgi:hypothetical protein
MILMDGTNSGTETGQQEHIQIFIWRIPKKNHDAMIQNCKRAVSTHTRYDQRLEFFRLDSAMLGSEYGCTNIDNIIPSSGKDDEEEVWLEINFHKDRKHMDDVAVTRQMEDSESADPIGKQFMDLIIPGSCLEGGFGRIRV